MADKLLGNGKHTRLVDGAGGGGVDGLPDQLGVSGSGMQIPMLVQCLFILCG